MKLTKKLVFTKSLSKKVFFLKKKHICRNLNSNRNTANYLSLESILNESDHSDEDESSDTFDADSSILHFVRIISVKDMNGFL